MTGPRVLFEDDTLPHQIRLFVSSSSKGQIAVSCCCLKRAGGLEQAGGSYEPLDARPRWEAAEALSVWRAHVQEATS